MQIAVTNQMIRSWEKESKFPYDLFWVWLEETKRPLQRTINQWIDFRLTGLVSKIISRDSLEKPVFIPLIQKEKLVYVLVSRNVSITGTEVSQKLLNDTVENFQKLKVQRVLVSPEAPKPIFFEGISRTNPTPKVSFDLAI